MSHADAPLPASGLELRVARRPRWTLAAVACAFFCSGVAALAFETLWFRQAGLAFGNSVWASSIVLSGFMAGMATGYGAGPRLARRSRRPLLSFALLEIAIAVSGTALVYLLPELPPALARLSAGLQPHALWLNLARLGLSFALLLLPAGAMGMGLPVLVAALRSDDAGFGRRLGSLYGINTLGAVLGCCATELWSIQLLGIHASALAASGFNLLSAGLALLAARTGTQPMAASTALGPAGACRALAQLPWLGSGSAAGFALLGLEVVWLRYLTLFLTDTDRAFTWLLACVLSGVGLGSLLGAYWARWHSHLGRFAHVIACAACVGLYLGYAAAGRSILKHFRFDESVLTLALPLALPAALASGLLFTALAVGLRQATRDDEGAAGRLALWNTLGGVAGALLGGFVLLPRLGIERSVLAFGAVYVAVAALLAFRTPGRRWPRLATLAVGALSLWLFPLGSLRPLFLGASVGRWMRPGDRVVRVIEGTAATYSYVLHMRNGQPWFDQLATNAYSMSVNDFAARRYMKQFVYLPRALHPKLERALVIGYGIGNTVAALVDDPTLERVDVVDTARESLALSRSMHTLGRPCPLDDPRVHVHIEDGRYFMQGHAGGYDLITGEPPPPIIAGVANLYTREYFRLMRSRLSPGGFASYWLPLMNISAPAAQAIIGAFCAAFDDCSLWHGSARNFMLLGTRGASGPVDEAHFRAQWRRPSVAAELAAVGFEFPEQLGATFIADAPVLRALSRGMPPLVDDHPKRVSMTASREARTALLWRLRDTHRARARFEHSPLIARLWPKGMRARSAHYFEAQRLINDLLFPGPTAARQLMVLHQVLQGTPLRLPVLLLMQSDPDMQRILQRLPAPALARPQWLLDRAAGYLARRQFAQALPVLKQLPKDELPFGGLLHYVEDVAGRSQHGRPTPQLGP